MLAYYRSQHHDQSWLAALAAIMDCCALILAGLESVPPLQARMTFIMARQILVEMAQSFGVQPSRYTGGDRLDHPAFLQLQRDLVEAGFTWSTSEAEELLAALRATLIERSMIIALAVNEIFSQIWRSDLFRRLEFVETA